MTETLPQLLKDYEPKDNLTLMKRDFSINFYQIKHCSSRERNATVVKRGKNA
jgi:hypothetical protein